jgi:hypothetical protein
LKTRRAFKPYIWHPFKGSSFHGNVVLNFMQAPRTEFAVYAHAYQEAGRRLTSELASRRGYSDVDACPIAFLYRHALELYLKSVIYWGNSLLRINKKTIVMNQKDLFRTHSLQKLVLAAKPIFRLSGALQNWPHPELKSFRHFERLVCHLERIDPGSYSFRYPIDRKGSASLPGHFCFNAIAFAEKIDAALKLLDGAATWAYEEFQTHAEMMHSSV